MAVARVGLEHADAATLLVDELVDLGVALAAAEEGEVGRADTLTGGGRVDAAEISQDWARLDQIRQD